MKKVYCILIAAVVLVFASCKKYDDDINRINDRLNRIEGTSINNIGKQIVGISGSLADLTAVDAALQKSIDALTAKNNELNEALKNNATADAATKAALEKEITDLNTLIASLQASNVSLDGKITALQSYVSGELSATEDWATATFATLEQYASLQTELAAVKALVDNNATVDELTQAINSAIVASEQSMKLWVNEQLAAGYYDIATIDAKLSALSGELTSADSELSKDIEAQRAALEQAKSELTAAYKEAISDAIETNNGVINATIASSIQAAIDKVDTKLAVINNALADIQKEIENIKSSIAGIQQQITGINSSLADLTEVAFSLEYSIAALTKKDAELKAYLNNLAAANAAEREAIVEEIAYLEASIASLQASNVSLKDKIKSLESYVSSELSATEDWATATFATLEQYASLQQELAAIKALVGNGSGNGSGSATVDELTQAINSAIVASEQSMKLWVNEQLAAGYYDIATIDAKLAALKSELTSADTNLAQQIETQNKALQQAKSDIKDAYTKAINEAILNNDGTIDTKIATAVNEAKRNLQEQINAMLTMISTIQTQINNIANRIQSVTYIPQYTDGKIKMDYATKTTELYLRISPAALATSIKKSMVKAFARYTDDPRTRALNEEFNVNVTQVSGNASSGILHICLAEDASNKFSKSFWDGYVEAIIYIQISDGNNDIVSPAVPVVGYSIEAPKTNFTVNGISFKMVQVKGGTFNMGSSTSGYADEQPVHSVTLSDYAIGETEVTQELWEAVMGTNPSNFKGNKKPVECVSWDDCQTFITKLNQLTGGKFRLPTEAEWEFAARGGTESKGYTYSGSNDIGDVAWYGLNSDYTTHDVATKAPNELGIYDMSGNVWEWCQDWYSSTYYSSSPANNPTGPSTGSYRVPRGGGWKYAAAYCRSSGRCSSAPVNSIINIGFRLAYGDLPEPEPEPDENVVTVNGVSFKMVQVKGGTFDMGSTSYDDEKPVHSVTLSDYAIGETEVTQELWEAVMGTNPSTYKGSKKPVESVSWDDCQRFISKLNELTGRNFRLPTEAEWEFAARGGVESKGYTYSGSNEIDDVAWYWDNSNHDVATKAANELGIYDMSGNVWEWCQDWYSSTYYSSSPVNNPTGPSTGSIRVIRGGSRDDRATMCRSSVRGFNAPSDSRSSIGLRLAL